MEKWGIFAATLFSFVVFRYWVMTPNVFGFLIFFQFYSLSVRLWFPLHCPSMFGCLNSHWHIQFSVQLLKRGILPFVKYAQRWELSVNTVNRVTLILKLYVATNVLQYSSLWNYVVMGHMIIWLPHLLKKKCSVSVFLSSPLYYFV